MIARDSAGDLRRCGKSRPARVELIEGDDAGAERVSNAVRDRRLAGPAAAVDEDPRTIGPRDGVEDATDRVVDDERSKRQRRFFLRHLMT